ncbi:unnamed protein product [Ilex paraguariensis]|uniref:F-box domain-containing protein n=1 Tax=Ilex paraguariensis TaxID=185542 RepID=A0ABC8U3L5_9AQUA
MELIPGLPDDVAFECLIRVPFDHLSTAASVSTAWKVKIELPEFRHRRKITGLTRPIIVMAQAKESHAMKFMSMPVYQLVVYEAESGNWYKLPPLPRFPNGLPMFCQLVGVGLDLIIMGGYDPVTWEVSKSVFIYNFISAKWRQGVDVPGGPRSFFACASDSDLMVFIAGGHDNNKNALRSVIMYDVVKDAWTPLPDMSRERDECKGVFHNEKFHVIGGYDTEGQGRFERSAEAFDIATWQWRDVEENFLGIATCPRTCVDGGDGRLYMCREGNVVVLENATWQVITGLPIEVINATYLTRWHDRLLVIGSPKFGEPHKGYVMDLKNQRWARLEAPEEYSGHVQSSYCLDI